MELSKNFKFCILFGAFFFLRANAAAINSTTENLIPSNITDEVNEAIGAENTTVNSTTENSIPSNIIDEVNKVIGAENTTDFLHSLFGGDTHCNETNNEVFTLCSNCYSTCQTLVPDSFMFPKPGCRCNDEYIKDETNNKCVDLKEAKTACGASDEIISEISSKKRNTIIDISIEQRILFLSNNSDIVLNSSDVLADKKPSPSIGDIEEPPVTVIPSKNTSLDVPQNETSAPEEFPTNSGTIPALNTSTSPETVKETTLPSAPSSTKPVIPNTNTTSSSTKTVIPNTNISSSKPPIEESVGTSKTTPLEEDTSIPDNNEKTENEDSEEDADTEAEDANAEETDTPVEEEVEDNEDEEIPSKSRSKRDTHKSKQKRAKTSKHIKNIADEGFSFYVNNEKVSVN